MMMMVMMMMMMMMMNYLTFIKCYLQAICLRFVKPHIRILELNWPEDGVQDSIILLLGRNYGPSIEIVLLTPCDAQIIRTTSAPRLDMSKSRPFLSPSCNMPIAGNCVPPSDGPRMCQNISQVERPINLQNVDRLVVHLLLQPT